MRERAKVLDEHKGAIDVEVQLLRSIVKGGDSFAIVDWDHEPVNLCGRPEDRVDGDMTNVTLGRGHLARMLDGKSVEFEYVPLKIGAYDESADGRLKDSYEETARTQFGGAADESASRDEPGEDTNEETVEVTLNVDISVEWHGAAMPQATSDKVSAWEKFFQEADS